LSILTESLLVDIERTRYREEFKLGDGGVGSGLVYEKCNLSKVI